MTTNLNEQALGEALPRERSLGSVVRGTPVLLLRQVLTVVVTVLGGIVLARQLTPSDFGVYALLLSLAGFLKLMTDGGLGAALVHQRATPTDHDYKQILTLQVAIAAVILTVIEIIVWSIPARSFSAHGWQLAVGIGALSAAAMPLIANAAAFLERDLRYSTLGVIGMVQPVAFNLGAVLLAVIFHSAWVLGVALLLSHIATVGVGRLSKAPLGLTANWTGLVHKLRFGVPYVGAQLVSTLKDAVNPMFIGLVLGAAAAGYVNWAGQFAAMPTLLVAALSRYVFPVLARSYGDRQRFERVVQLGLFLFTSSVAPLALAIALFAQPVTALLYGDRWYPAIQLVWLLSAANVLSPATSILLAAVSAMGRPSIALKMTMVWFVGTWVLVPLFVSGLGLGMIGFAWANLVLQLPGIALFVIVGRSTRLAVPRTVILPWVIAGVAVTVSWLVSRPLDGDPRFDAVQVAIAIGGVLAGWVAIAVAGRSQLRTLKGRSVG